ncbi:MULTISPECIES: ABC transporter substrate-binding protein [Metallosphaera]|uniref:Extracellular solute-binding protein, family 5 n=3 Tax=Metallosphaera TaxID=41980 RepID=A4YIT9_METS5|nr:MULTISPECIES: ABC transporter substrate-binding protein [Metallosphaera]ABP96341.1 extracellular solute-binding protein, family 5 [Metallosphaera sedula DSM 5348]AIM28324.1 extracellular solute-binding protein, family 5 [Metallosphaera sedula]AKV75124.1 ABC transporter substrate-binding protein [Metallosphaera sedula]AKV77362.1 ABC transporter substrate-binding protein [Metallosphaera sedula]AKV79613.1 ABC transporter substrate-binding protein [Metallosphaera sedula]
MYKAKRIKFSRALSRTAAIAIAIIIIIAAIAGIYLLTSTHKSVTVQAISLAPTSFASEQGNTITFTIYGVTPGSNVVLYLGDGHEINETATSNTLEVSYTYNQPGTYLVYAVEYLNGKPVQNTSTSLLQIQVLGVLNSTATQFLSIPVISFDTAKNPSAPIVQAGTPVFFYGGYLQPPSGQNITISKYIWNFGNGQTLTVNANSSTLDPEINPVNTTYTTPGLYTVTLTLVTQNTSSGTTYEYTTYQSIAVTGSGVSFALKLFNGTVPNPGVITVAENVPGGPYSFDPQIDYESVGFEVVSNIFMTLVLYNGSSTTSFIPFAATEIPTVQNGGIQDNYTVYTFHIRSGLHFSNGDNLTAYDVWYSTIRALLFVGGSPGTPDWILAQYLVPGATIGVPIVTSSNMNQTFQEIMNAVTYNNQTNTVTFHLVKPTPPQLFFTAVADPLGSGIVDAKWLEQVGAGITFTPQGFLQYEQYANEGNYNTQVQNNPVASGPYMIKTYVPGQYIVLVPNPYFHGVPGVPAPNDTVIINWVKDPQTAYELFTSGKADIVTELPTNYFPSLKQLEAQGQANIYQFPTLSEFFFVFNINISNSSLKTLGSQYHIPSDYFANLYVREAFAYAFNYTNYIDNIVGNEKYGFDFASPYAGVIIPGLPYYVPPSELSNVPTFNLTYAKELLIKSGMYNVSINIPIIVSSGDTVDYAAAQMWAQALNQIDPNIQAQPLYLPFSEIIGLEVPGQNPMPIYYLGWIADYPYPSDFVNAMYLENGTYPAPDGWTVQYLQSLGHTNQARLYQELNTYIEEADNTANATQAAYYYKQAEQIAIDLYMYVYTQQPNAFWVVKPYMTGYQGHISYEENPMIGGAGDSLYFWWVKG